MIPPSKFVAVAAQSATSVVVNVQADATDTSCTCCYLWLLVVRLTSGFCQKSESGISAPAITTEYPRQGQKGGDPILTARKDEKNQRQ